MGGGYGAIVGYRGIVGLGYVSISPTPGTNPWFPPHAPGLHPKDTPLYSLMVIVSPGIRGNTGGRGPWAGGGYIQPIRYRTLVL